MNPSLLLLLVACGGAPEAPDPRPSLLAALGTPGPAANSADAFLRAESPGLACVAAAADVAGGNAGEWPFLLTASARATTGSMHGGSSPSRPCLSREEQALLAAWACVEGPGAASDAAVARLPAWRGACAEARAAGGDLAGAQALARAPGAEVARLRVLLAGGTDEATVRDAAESALVEDPADGRACTIVARGRLQEGDAAGAIEQAACRGTRTVLLDRVRADALDAAGAYADAAEAWRGAGLDVHAAAVLLQEFPERRDEALALLHGDRAQGPLSALLLAWDAVARGERPAASGALDRSAAAELLWAITDPQGVAPDVLSRLRTLGDARTEVVLARGAGARGDRAEMEAALDRARQQAPASEPVHRARVALRAAHGGDVAGALADWAAQDPDHVRLTGTRGNRERPWAAIAPWSWPEACGRARHDARCGPAAPSGADDIGATYRAAMSPDCGKSGEGVAPAEKICTRATRIDALDALQAAHPELVELTRARWDLQTGVSSEPERDPPTVP